MRLHGVAVLVLRSTIDPPDSTSREKSGADVEIRIVGGVLGVLAQLALLIAMGSLLASSFGL